MTDIDLLGLEEIEIEATMNGRPIKRRVEGAPASR